MTLVNNVYEMDSNDKIRFENVARLLLTMNCTHDGKITSNDLVVTSTALSEFALAVIFCIRGRADIWNDDDVEKAIQDIKEHELFSYFCSPESHQKTLRL